MTVPQNLIQEIAKDDANPLFQNIAKRSLQQERQRGLKESTLDPCPELFNWNEAYDLFLECNPLETINKELEKLVEKNFWNDYGFSITTPMKELPLQMVNGVISRAIMLVIWRNRMMSWKNIWVINYPKLEKERHQIDLTIEQKLLINNVVLQLYGF